ncbi:MAG TPA: MBL fold metallo-hydrolase [Polyangia bacterium]
MRVDLIGHASLLVRGGGLTLLTDPWWAGPAYAEQWYPWPLPVPERYDLDAINLLYLSHGHEDHLHPQTLAELPHEVEVILPASYDPGNLRYLEELGFPRTRELASGRTVSIDSAGGPGQGGMRLTLFTYLGDSLLAIEADGEVMIDLNDALHAARREVIETYCALLRRRFPRIDYLFCGFGGASYFPNCFRLPGKDDAEVARRRERCFLDNLALISERLRPRFVFPFAAHFVLPSEHTWWISRERLSAPPPSSVLAPLCPSVRFVDLQPGDHVEGGQVSASQPTPVDPEEVRRQVLAKWPRTSRPKQIGDAEFDRLVALLDGKAAGARRRAHPFEAPLDALVRLWDYPSRAISVKVERGRPTISAAPKNAEAPIVLETRAHLLEAALTQDYGRDLICIGYGGLFRVSSAEAVRRNLHERLLDLVTSFPSWRERLEQHPLMCMRFFARDPGARLALRTRLLGRAHPPSPLYSLAAWV